MTSSNFCVSMEELCPIVKRFQKKCCMYWWFVNVMGTQILWFEIDKNVGLFTMFSALEITPLRLDKMIKKTQELNKISLW